MKRLALLFICAVAIFSSCAHSKHSYSSVWKYDGDTHYRICESKDCDSVVGQAPHSFSEEAGDDSATTVSTCTVCGYKVKSEPKPTHSHSFSDAYTSTSTQHWRTCSECNEITDMSEHTWSKNEIKIPPTSESEGEAERYCTVCGKYSTVTLDRLPEKMGEDEWKKHFEFDNLRIRERSKNGAISSTDAVYAVDGELVSVVTSSGTAYLGRSVLAAVDFSEKYSDFSHYGEGVYKSSTVDTVTDSGNQRLYDVTVVFENGELTSISYSIKFGGFGSMDYTYTFFDRGAVELNPTYIDADLLLAVTEIRNFQGNFTLSFTKHGSPIQYSESEVTVLNGAYTCKNFENSKLKNTLKGEAEKAAQGISEHLFCMLSVFSYKDFVYEDLYDDYTYVGCGTEIPDVGTVKSCDLVITEGRLSFLTVTLENGVEYYYEFYYE